MILLIAGFILTLLGASMLIYLAIGTIQLRKVKKEQETVTVTVPVSIPVSDQNSDISTKTVDVSVEFTDFPDSILQTGIKIGNAQDIGARNEQQDSFGISNMEEDFVKNNGILAIVADGMGGMSNGSQYSKLTVQTALQSFNNENSEKDDETTLLRILKRVTDAVENSGLEGGGSTLVAVLIREKLLHFISVGDSRIYLMRNGGLIQLNREHVYGRELDDMVANGLKDAEEAAADPQRAALTSFIGISSEMKVDRNIRPIPLYSGDKIVLMSDGIYGFISEGEMKELLLQEPMEAAEAIRNAVVAKQNPQQDNLTIVILEI